jgi:hypothetical protein
MSREILYTFLIAIIAAILGTFIQHPIYAQIPGLTTGDDNSNQTQQQANTLNNNNNGSGFLTYENPAGFRIQYPADWQLKETRDHVFFYTPGTSISTVIIGVLDTNKTLSELANKMSSPILPNQRIIVSFPTTLSGLPAHQIVSSLQIGSDVGLTGSTVAVKENKEYSLIYVLTPEVTPVIKQMLDSFQVIK